MEGIHQRKASNEDHNPEAEQAVEFQDEEKKMQEDGMSGSMTENVYSLIYIADSTSSAFWISMLCVVFQLTMICLVLVDMIKPNNTENPLGVPNNVSGVVRVAGFMSLFLSVALFWDLMDAIDKLVRDRVALKQQFHRRLKFYFAFTLQLAIGILFLIAIFILVVRSTDVLGMFLNYAAMQFITEVDDIAFKLAALGYVGKSMKKECEKVKDFKLPPARRPFLRRIIYYSVTILLFIGYIIIWARQQHGKYDYQRIEVQFGDGFIPFLPLFSGHYACHADFHDGRPIYKDETGKAIFRYCYGGGSGYWVFGWFSPFTGIGNMDDLCTNFVSRTPQTSGFGILDTPGSNWLVKQKLGAKLEYSVDHFVIRNADCDETTCNGRCQKKKCVCSKSQYGVNCQFDGKPCGMVDYDHNFNSFSGAQVTNETAGIGDVFNSQYTLLQKSDGKPALKYGRAIYAHIYPNNHRLFGRADVILNNGRRYIVAPVNLTDTNLYPNATTIQFDLANNVEHLYLWDDRGKYYSRPFFVSSPIDVGTSTDSLSPVGLTWSRIDPKKNSFVTPGVPLSTILICAQCFDTDSCNDAGTCNNETSTCNCISGYEGHMCEKEPPCVLAGNCR